jgi:flagellar biosynthesis GTPase FlhF
MRTRTTWHSNRSATPRQAATSRRADIYTMNQEHPQPTAVEYMNGSPDEWAETPVPADKAPVNAEYEGDHVKRNELGFGEFRDDTWKHKDSENWGGSGKYDNAKVSADRKATAAERIARAILRTSNEELVEQTAIDLMALPDRSMVSVLRRMEASSPAALPADSKHRRAYACTKLAFRMLGSSCKDEDAVQTLASTLMNIDDITLKAMIKSVAAATHLAQQDDQDQQDQQGSHTSQEEDDDEEDDDEEQVAQQQQGQQDQQSQQQQSQQQQSQQDQQQQQSQQDQQVGQQQQSQQQLSQQDQQQQQQGQQQDCMAQEQEGCGLAPTELQMLDDLLHHEMAEPADDLTALFGEVPAAAAPPAVPAMGVATDMSDITFDDDDGELPSTTASVMSLDDLFADDPEVKAQREIQAAANEQFRREIGFTNVARTASTNGAKKLGQVRNTAVSVDQALESLWERPGQ